jgi:hypothetical protein
MKDMNGYYITSDNPTVKVPVEPREVIDLSYKKIIELVLPKCKIVYCFRNELKELIIPMGCVEVQCQRNNLTKLILPDSCEEVWCNNNQLIELNLPKNCIFINCFENYISKLIIPNKCKMVGCYNNNNLSSIIVNLLESGNRIKIQLANNLQR